MPIPLDDGNEGSRDQIGPSVIGSGKGFNSNELSLKLTRLVGSYNFTPYKRASATTWHAAEAKPFLASWVARSLCLFDYLC